MNTLHAEALKVLDIMISRYAVMFDELFLRSHFTMVVPFFVYQFDHV